MSQDRVVAIAFLTQLDMARYGHMLRVVALPEDRPFDDLIARLGEIDFPGSGEPANGGIASERSGADGGERQ